MRFADFEFEDEDYRADDKNDINAFSHAGNGVLEIDATGTIGEDVFENFNFLEPCIALGVFRCRATTLL